MGLMDSLVNGLKKAAEEIDKQAGLSGENSLGSFAAQAEKVYKEAVGGSASAPASASSQPAPAKAAQNESPAQAQTPTRSSGARTPDYILNDTTPVEKYEVMEDFHSHEGRKVRRSLELPEFDFDLSDSGALEISSMYVYRPGKDDYFNGYELVKPAILVELSDGALTGKGGRTPVSHGIMTESSGGWVDYKGRSIRYYIFKDFSGSEQLFMLECLPDVIGSPFEQKIIGIFDHAAETLREESN